MSSRKIVLFKYGGNAMSNPALQARVLANICALKARGFDLVIAHGGGPFIQARLDEANIPSEFIDGQRKTSPAALEQVEMALKGQVNGQLVAIINRLGHRAVGLSGKDGRLVVARKRWHQRQGEPVDLGRVGDVAAVDPTLIHLLLANDFIPVVACLAADAAGDTYNINGDLFAGHLAGALAASHYVVLTDVDGLRRDKDDPATLLRDVPASELPRLRAQNVIQGGMIPKAESCAIALERGAQAAHIINGTAPEQIAALFNGHPAGTTISKPSTITA
jgi:acetylglutamate kinase